MKTKHGVHIGDSRELTRLDDDSVELVVTSPPYPMIELWDSVFGDLNPDIRNRLNEDEGRDAFRLMHEELDKTWAEVSRVLIDGGIACINIGDATRKVDGSFRVYQNHARVIDAFEDIGFQPLPDIIWRKPANSATKFMGSGMVPPNAYATLEHEYLLAFRNGQERRSFEPHSRRRYNAAYFWEERNEWFSDVWMDVQGSLQDLNDNQLRERSGAFPLQIPYRLITMYSVYGDTVLDPFWGTGTTTMGAMVAGRNSVGFELQEQFTDLFDGRVGGVTELSSEIIGDRIRKHREFASMKEEEGDPLNYPASNYDFLVMTKQEQEILFYVVDGVDTVNEGYAVTHSTFDAESGYPPESDARSTHV